jgi:hypothetical protein
VRYAFHGLAQIFSKDKSMRKLIQASLLTLALTARIYAGDMQQPKAAGEMQQPLAAQGYMPNGITETALSILGAMLSLI